MINTALIQFFVGFSLILILISDSDQKKSSLTTVDCNLSDNLIETLLIKFLSHRTKAYLSGLSLNQSFIQLFA